MGEYQDEIYVVRMDEEIAKRIKNLDGKYLKLVGSEKGASYFATLSSKIFNLADWLNAGEGIRAEPATRENLQNFLPSDFFDNLERIVGCKII